MQLTAAEWAAVALAAMAPQQQYAGTFRRRAAAKPRACKPCGRRAKGKAILRLTFGSYGFTQDTTYFTFPPFTARASERVLY